MGSKLLDNPQHKTHSMWTVSDLPRHGWWLVCLSVPSLSILIRPLSPSGDVLEEEDEGDADADESDRHGGDDQLLQTVEQLLLRAPPQRQSLLVQVLQQQ